MRDVFKSVKAIAHSNEYFGAFSASLLKKIEKVVEARKTDRPARMLQQRRSILARQGAAVGGTDAASVPEAADDAITPVAVSFDAAQPDARAQAYTSDRSRGAEAATVQGGVQPAAAHELVPRPSFSSHGDGSAQLAAQVVADAMGRQVEGFSTQSELHTRALAKQADVHAAMLSEALQTQAQSLKQVHAEQAEALQHLHTQQSEAHGRQIEMLSAELAAAKHAVTKQTESAGALLSSAMDKMAESQQLQGKLFSDMLVQQAQVHAQQAQAMQHQSAASAVERADLIRAGLAVSDRLAQTVPYPYGYSAPAAPRTLPHVTSSSHAVAAGGAGGAPPALRPSRTDARRPWGTNAYTPPPGASGIAQLHRGPVRSMFTRPDDGPSASR